MSCEHTKKVLVGRGVLKTRAASWALAQADNAGVRADVQHTYIDSIEWYVSRSLLCYAAAMSCNS